MSRCDITLHGCDDSTYLFDVEMTEEEFAAITRIADLSVEAGGGCAPTISVARSPLRRPDGECCGNCWTVIADDSWKRNKYGEWVHEVCPEGDDK